MFHIWRFNFINLFCSVLSSSILLSHKPAIFNPFDPARIQDVLQNKKVTWRCKHNTNNRFFYLTKRKKPILWTTQTTIFIHMIARVFIQRKQPYLWLIANNDGNILWGHNSRQILFESSLKHSYVPYKFYNFNN